jgi:hypothetical protein
VMNGEIRDLNLYRRAPFAGEGCLGGAGTTQPKCGQVRQHWGLLP